MNIENVRQILVENGINTKGCSVEEIVKIEQFYGVKFPSLYIDFLKSMGKDGGKYMRGDSCFYNEIFDLKEGAEEVISENELPPLPANAYVFWMHQGYQFTYFLIDENADPAVYYFSEGSKEKNYILKNDTLSQFFNDQLFVSGILTE